MHGDGGEPKNRQRVRQEHSYILIRVVNNSPRQLLSMLIVGAFTASSGSRTMRFAASLGRSNSLRHALSVLLTSAPGFASPRGLEDRHRHGHRLTIAHPWQRVIPTLPPSLREPPILRRLASALADLLAFAPRRGAERNGSRRISQEPYRST